MPFFWPNLNMNKNIKDTIGHSNMHFWDITVIYEYRGIECLESGLPWQTWAKCLLGFMVPATCRTEFMTLLI